MPFYANEVFPKALLGYNLELIKFIIKKCTVLGWVHIPSKVSTTQEETGG